MRVSKDTDIGQIQYRRVAPVLINRTHHQGSERYSIAPILQPGVGTWAGGDVVRVLNANRDLGQLQKIVECDWVSDLAAHRRWDLAFGKYIVRGLVGVDSGDVRALYRGQPAENAARRMRKQHGRADFGEQGSHAIRYDCPVRWAGIHSELTEKLVERVRRLRKLRIGIEIRPDTKA